MRDGPVVSVACTAMATRFEAVLWGAPETRLRAAGEEALEEVQRCEAMLSRFRPGSDIYHVNAGAAREPVRVDARVLQVLGMARDLSDATHGAFDVTVGPLRRLWGFDAGSGSVPSAQELERARSLVGMRFVKLCPDASTVQFAKPGVEIDLGGIGKGYAVECAAQVIRQAGISGALVHGGTSTVQALGTAPDGGPWRIGLRDPGEPSRMLGFALLEDCALSISAPHGKAFRSGDRRYGHVLDPRSGLPVQGTLLAAVRCPSATASDALSTALLVLGEEYAHELTQGDFAAGCLVCLGTDRLKHIVAAAW